jgi:hypothetical protein
MKKVEAIKEKRYSKDAMIGIVAGGSMVLIGGLLGILFFM